MELTASIDWVVKPPDSMADFAALFARVPEGRAGWTLKLLADRLVEREIVESISRETVRQTLKKTTQALAERRFRHPLLKTLQLVISASW